MNLDEYLFRTINGLAHHSILLDRIMIIFSKYMVAVFMAALGIFYVIGLFNKNEKMRGIAIDTFVITVINLVLSFVIGIFYYVPRPFVHSKVNLLIPHTADASFPSDHAIGTISIAAGVNKYNKLYGGILILLSILVGISRVYVGHHYPSDVIGGYIIALSINYLYGYFVKDKIQNLYFKIEELLVKHVPILEKYI